MSVYRCILPNWAVEKYPDRKRVLEGEFTEEQVYKFNQDYYNVYFLPNQPTIYDPNTLVNGSHIDQFRFCFVDMDLKDNVYEDKILFVSLLKHAGLDPTYIVDSGNGIHAYWQISDLDAKSYLRLQRRLMRKFKTDEAVGQIFQLMRAPDTVNTKYEDDFKLCEMIYQSDKVYTCEDLDKFLPQVTPEDITYCDHHYDKTYNLQSKDIKISDQLPLKFAHLLKSNNEVKEIWSGNTDDRSRGDYRLGHIMLASGFTKEEAVSVLVNTAKAASRAPIHRLSYATNIVESIGAFETAQDKNALLLSSSVKEILSKSGDTIKGTRFPCWRYLDDTEHGFRLGQVIGLVAGSGVGKTAIALNMFLGFVQNNPDYDHFFIPLEQPANEIADRWRTLCGAQEHLYEKVHVISNYDDSGAFRHLSFTEIKDYLLKFQEVTGRKIGCVVIDHIGALKKKGKEGENQDLMDICHSMKAFAIETNTLLVMQSQAPRQKAGIGDLELDKDAAYGTMYFEAYCDYLITLWQPLKRMYAEGAPTVSAFKFCKIRHKKQGIDGIKEDVCYKMMFDPHTQRLKEMTEEEDKSFAFFLNKATNKRKNDRKSELVEYTSIKS